MVSTQQSLVVNGVFDLFQLLKLIELLQIQPFSLDILSPAAAIVNSLPVFVLSSLSPSFYIIHMHTYLYIHM